MKENKIDLKEIKESLSGYDDAAVTNYISYIDRLITDKKNDGSHRNWWLHNGYVKEGKLISIFKRVANDKLYIDGDIVTLSYKNKLMADYSYHAYRKKLLMIYPETMIDSQVVYEDDEFSFEKNSGVVVYSHKFKNPFGQKDENIIGAYCIVRNSKGEFIELLSKDEAEKMKEIAKTKNIWDQWASRMYLKSVIKRICKTFFYDSFQNMESIDNENYDLEKVNNQKLILKISEALEHYQDDDKDEIVEMLNTKMDSGEANTIFLEEIAKRIGLKIEE